jgi:copper chaperone
MTRQVLEIGGMSCGHCLASVRGALEALPGVKVEELKLGSATVSFDEQATEPAAVAKAIAQAVEDAGYDVLASESR